MLSMKEKSKMRYMGDKIKITAERKSNKCPCVFYCKDNDEANKTIEKICAAGVLEIVRIDHI